MLSNFRSAFAMSFTPDEVKKAVIDSLSASSVPAGHKGAFVVFVDDAGAKATIAFKAEHGWEINGTAQWHPHEDGLSAGVNILKTW